MRIDAKREKLQLVLHIGGAATHQALNGIDGAFGLGEQAAARGFSNDNAAVGIEANDGRAEGGAVGAGNTPRLARLRVHVRDQTVSGSQIDADNASH